MTTPTKNRTLHQSRAAAKAAGRAIIADLTEFAEALEAGIALEKTYTVRRVELPDAPARRTPQSVRATRARSHE